MKLSHTCGALLLRARHGKWIASLEHFLHPVLINEGSPGPKHLRITFHVVTTHRLISSVSFVMIAFALHIYITGCCPQHNAVQVWSESSIRCQSQPLEYKNPNSWTIQTEKVLIPKRISNIEEVEVCHAPASVTLHLKTCAR